MKSSFIRSKEFLTVYTVIIILNFTIPFLLPSKVIGSYLFWIILSISTIIYGILTVGRR